MLLTSTTEAKRFAEETDVDALAVAVGNAHRMYNGDPDLRLDRLQEINEVVRIPLVLHGGSGISQRILSNVFNMVFVKLM